MSELPERIWAPSVDILALEVFASLARKKANSGQAYLRADTAIPKAEAEAMVAAVVESCGEVLEECGIDGSAFAQTFEEYRTGRAALDKIVQEAVEAERERVLARTLEAVGYTEDVLSPDDIAAIRETGKKETGE